MTKNDLKKYSKEISKRLTKSLVVLDVESSGLDTTKDEIIQFAAIRINLDGSFKELEFKCKPSVDIHPKASEVHGMSNESLKDLPPFKDFIPKILELLDGADVSGFNIVRFDLKLIDRQLEEHGHTNVLKDAFILDSYTVFCKHVSRRLADAHKYYTSKDIEDAHDALGDVKTTIAIIASQLEKENRSVVEIATELNGKPEERVGSSKHIIFNEKGEPVINFSKHKGILLKDIDKGFLRWMMKQDFPKATKEFLQPYLKN